MKAKIQFVLMTVVLVVAWMLAPRAQAQQVLWGSPVGVASETSAGAAVDASFTFQVGAFFEDGAAGWTPGAANTAEWADHWLAADSAVYDEAMKTFTGACLVDPMFGGAQGYIWGFDATSGDGEWILMTDPAWVFPASASALSFPSSWQTSSATVVIVGTVDQAATAGFHLKTGPVTESALPYVPSEQWLGMHFSVEQLAQPWISGWSADPDEDGMSNLLEMAIGAPPRHAGGGENLPEPGFVEVGGNFFLSLAVQRASNVAAVLGAEVSSDLIHWESGAGHVTVVSDDLDALLVRDNIAIGGEEKRYIRLKVTLGE